MSLAGLGCRAQVRSLRSWPSWRSVRATSCGCFRERPEAAAVTPAEAGNRTFPFSAMASHGMALIMRLVVLTASWLPVAVHGWIDADGRICFSDEQMAVIALAVPSGQPLLERRLSGGWLQRSRGWEPYRVPSFIAAGTEFFELDGAFRMLHPLSAAPHATVPARQSCPSRVVPAPTRADVLPPGV